MSFLDKNVQKYKMISVHVASFMKHKHWWNNRNTEKQTLEGDWKDSVYLIATSTQLAEGSGLSDIVTSGDLHGVLLFCWMH